MINLVDRYGFQAHQLLADVGIAPQLFYCGLLYGKPDIRNAGSRAEDSLETYGLYIDQILMVVMEHTEGDTLGDAPTLPEDARDQTATAIQKLHDAQLVFGDLRARNITVSGNKAILIDFDWAGEAGKVRYPRNLSGSVVWPEDARLLEMKPALVAHNLFMLDQLNQFFTRRRVPR